MDTSVRPSTRIAAALMAAGVISAATVVGAAEPHAIPMVSADVVTTSRVTDTLYGLGQGVGVLTSTVGIHVDAVISLPFEATLALVAAAQHPELAANVASYLVQRFVNPAVGEPIDAYPWEFREVIAVLAGLLPYPLGPSASDPGFVLTASQAVADAFDGVLSRLADPFPGLAAVDDVEHDTALGRTVVAGQLAVRAPLYMAWNTVNYLGMLPAYLAATVESAVETPDQIPGLVSNLAYGLLSPDPEVGLVGKLLDNAADPLTWLPGPIGYHSEAKPGAANQIRDGVADAIDGKLSALPEPVRPSVLPPATEDQLAHSMSARRNAYKPVEKAAESDEPDVPDTATRPDRKHRFAKELGSVKRDRKTSIEAKVTRAVTRHGLTKPDRADRDKSGSSDAA